MLQDLNETTHIMQSVLAPVFLISGVAALLGPMTTRYGRIIDHTRLLLKEAATHPPDAKGLKHLHWQVKALHYRARLLRTVIIFASASIFCIALTIFLMFSEFVFQLNVGPAPVVLFVASLVSLLAAMAFFIQDFAISLRVLKLDIRHGLQGDPNVETALTP